MAMKTIVLWCNVICADGYAYHELNLCAIICACLLCVVDSCTWLCPNRLSVYGIGYQCISLHSEEFRAIKLHYF